MAHQPGREALPEAFRVNRFKVLDSTNAEALRRGAIPGEAYLADLQTSGRGRLGRRWQSPRGNLHATLVAGVPDGRRPTDLAFVAGVAVLEALEQTAPMAPFSLKWPNDILSGGRKLAGILIEAGEGGYAVGIGINLTSAPPDDEVNVPATHLRESAGTAVAADEVMSALCDSFGWWHAKWTSDGYVPIRARWLASAHRIGDTIAASTGQERLTGRFAGLNEEGALLLDDDAGMRHIIAAGDVMLNGAA